MQNPGFMHTEQAPLLRYTLSQVGFFFLIHVLNFVLVKGGRKERLDRIRLSRKKPASIEDAAREMEKTKQIPRDSNPLADSRLGSRLD